jgi:hypothetical protein
VDRPTFGLVGRQVDQFVVESHQAAGDAAAPRQHRVAAPEERVDQVFGRIVGRSQDIDAEGANTV